MAHMITHAPEPQKLYLAWQAPDHMGVRVRWAVGVVEADRSELTLRYFQDDEEFRQLNGGRTLADAQALSYQGYPGLPLKRAHWEGVRGAFMRRLPPRSRHDFGDYLKQFRISPDLELTDLVLLGITEAKLPSDGFSLVDPLHSDHGDRDLMLEVAGFRYYSEFASDIRVDDRVEISLEPDNEFDSGAVMFAVRGVKIGNLNRLQAPTFRGWILGGYVEGFVERLNGNSVKPRAFIFVRVRQGQDMKAKMLASAE